MNWAEEIIKTLKDWNTSMIVYVPDISIDQVTSLIEKDPFFRLVPATREEEAIGIAVGSYAVAEPAGLHEHRGVAACRVGANRDTDGFFFPGGRDQPEEGVLFYDAGYLID